MPPQGWQVPTSNATYPVGTMSPADAAAIVKRSMTAGFDPLKLAALRDARMGEMEDRQAQDLRTGDVRDLFGTRANMADLSRDIDEDPSVGLRERARVGNTEDALSNAAVSMRPEIEDASRAAASRNAFAKWLEAKAPFKAAISPEGEQALNEASARRMAEMAASYGLNPQKQKLTAEGQKAVDALHMAVDLGNKLHAVLTNPQNGLQSDPNAARSSGFVDQAGDAAKAALKRQAYSWGILQSPPGYDEATLLADQLKVVGSRPLLGSVRNMEWVKQIQDHLTNGRLPPAANLMRLETFLKNAPDLEKDIYDAELGHQRLPGAAAPVSIGAPGSATMAPNSSDLYQAYLRQRGGGAQE